MSKPIIQTQELTKHYGNIKAVDHLDLTVSEGEIFGFLGPNGAGKTTTLLMLMGLTVPTSGTATVAGLDIIEDSREIRKIAGLLPEGAGYYEDSTARQNLDYMCQLNDIPKLEGEKRINEFLETLKNGQHPSLVYLLCREAGILARIDLFLQLLLDFSNLRQVLFGVPDL